MEMKNLELKRGYQQIASHKTIAGFKFANMNVQYTYVMSQVEIDEERAIYAGYLMRTIKGPDLKVMGEMIKTWVDKTPSYEDDLHKLINKDREMLAKQILQEEDEEDNE